MKKQTVKKIFNVTLNVLMYAFIVFALLIVIFSVTGKKNDGATSIFGHQLRVVVSRSMEKCDQTDVSAYAVKDIPLRSMVFVQECPAYGQELNEWCKGLKVGDVLTFKYFGTDKGSTSNQPTITHRIIEITPNDTQDLTKGYTIKLQGDNKPALENNPEYAGTVSVGTQVIDTSKIGPDFVNYRIIGKVVGQSFVLGFLVSGVSEPLVMILLVIVPCLIIIILEVVKMVNYFGAEKKKKTKEKIDSQESEIEALKRQLEQLQNKLDQTGEQDGNLNNQDV